jgi:hypothetical protein
MKTFINLSKQSLAQHSSLANNAEMKFRLDRVPTSFDQAVEEVLNGLEPHEREQLLSLDSDQLHTLHPSLGAIIREAWSLWDEGTPLKLDCQKRGLPEHTDDLAMAILAEAWSELCGA